MKKLLIFLFIATQFVAGAYARHATLSDISTTIFSEQKEYGQHLDTTFKSFPDSILPSIKKVDFEDAIGRLCGLLSNQINLDDQASYIQKVTVGCDARVIVMGDLHGSVHSLLRNLLRLYAGGILRDNFELADNCYFVFTGDYTDRGRYGVEVWYLLARLRLANPDRVFLIRGNHETEDIKDSSFDLELTHKYRDKILNEKVYSLFDYLPVAVLIGCGKNYVMACHGGLPVSELGEFLLGDEIKDFVVKENDKDVGFMAIKSQEVIQQFLWNDFIDGEKIFVSERGLISAHEIGIGVVGDMLEAYGIKALLRGHDHNKYAVSMYKMNKKHEISPDLARMTQFFCDIKGLKKSKLYDVSGKVFTLMSCPEGLGGRLSRRAADDYKKCNVDGYGILYFDSELSVPKLKACEYKLPASDDRDRKYVRKVVDDYGGVDFKWVENVCYESEEELFGWNKEELLGWLTDTCEKEGIFVSGSRDAKPSPVMKAEIRDWLDGCDFRL